MSFSEVKLANEIKKKKRCRQGAMKAVICEFCKKKKKKTRKRRRGWWKETWKTGGSRGGEVKEEDIIKRAG